MWPAKTNIAPIATTCKLERQWEERFEGEMTMNLCLFACHWSKNGDVWASVHWKKGYVSWIETTTFWASCAGLIQAMSPLEPSWWLARELIQTELYWVWLIFSRTIYHGSDSTWVYHKRIQTKLNWANLTSETGPA